MNTHLQHKETNHRIAGAIIFALVAYGGLGHKLALATDSGAAHGPELRQTILGLALEGLSLDSTPEQAHAILISAGYKAHQGNKPGNGIYWKKQTKKLTRRILLKTSDAQLIKLQFSFIEKNGDEVWRQVLGDIKSKLGTALHLCQETAELNLNCKLTSESPDMLSAHVTASHGGSVNKIRVNLDRYLPTAVQGTGSAYSKPPAI